MYDIKPARGHYEIYLNGKLIATADSYEEALEEIPQEDIA